MGSIVVSDEIFGRRIEKCNNCEHKIAVVHICKKCGCPVYSKARMIHSDCPDNRWSKEIC